MPDFPVLAGVEPVCPEPDLPVPAWLAPDCLAPDWLEPDLPEDEEELEPLAPPLLGGDPPLAEPAVPAGGCMDVLVQAASHTVAASPTTRGKFRCLSMENCPLRHEPKYTARADGTGLLHAALE